MDKFVKNFIGVSILYLILSSVIGILMLAYPQLTTLKFVHSHLNMLGWVSMMIYGVGYHILPRFVGKKLKSNRLGEIQFWLANIGLVGMLGAYSIGQYNTDPLYKTLTVFFGVVEAVSIAFFFYNMIATLFAEDAA
ncbi:MAG: cbb3-type cytochrome c oxidase subunit I [Nitrospirae bacterium]|nr:cbb3-type cytochrome c oxidase subunit I [Nitrospirota bacterium]